MRIFLDGNYHTNGDLAEARSEHLAEDPSFDVSRLTLDPVDVENRNKEVRASAMEAVDRLHARALVNLCGQATVEERDTWPVKLAAAEAVISGDPSEAQLAMLTAEAGEQQEAVEALANKIIFKSGMYQRVVGIAAKLRADGKNSLEGVDVADLPAQLKEIERQAQLYVAERAAEVAAEMAAASQA